MTVVGGFMTIAPVGVLGSAACCVACSGVLNSAGTGVTGARFVSFLDSGSRACGSADCGTASAAAGRAVEPFPSVHAPRAMTATASAAATTRHLKFALIYQRSLGRRRGHFLQRFPRAVLL